MGRVGLLNLLDFLEEHFNISELKDLIFELKIDYDNIPGETKQDKARELILYLQRNARLQELYTVLEKKFEDNSQILGELETEKLLLSNNRTRDISEQIVQKPTYQRPYHTLISSKYVDKKIAHDLYTWLFEVARIPVWYDLRNLPVSSNIDTEFPTIIGQCRSIILLLSRDSVTSEGLKKQYNHAADHKKKYNEFRILPVRIDDCDLPPYMDIDNSIDLNDSKLDLETANELLFSLYYNDIGAEFEKPEIYVSRTWRENKESELANYVCKQLISKGFRLIGDSKDREGYDEERIKSIISSCGELVSILPDRGRGTTSTYMVEEIEIALDFKMPCLIVTEPNVQLSEQLERLAIRLAPESIRNIGESHDLHTSITTLREEWKNPAQPHYVFFATDLENKKRNRWIKEHIQRITCMECIIGDDIKEVPLLETIIAKISRAFMIIADISEENINTVIEAGIAIGKGFKENLHLIKKGPRQKPPFMFSDKQILYYADDLELFGLVHSIAFQYRRRVLNYEISH